MKNTLKVSLFLLFIITVTGVVSASEFPEGPELSVTPGKLCESPTKYRYPEKIAYCERDVTYDTKETVIDEYDQKFGYIIGQMNRTDFKIDHLIPLCAGGSNDITNLWPQHKSVYKITDPLEPVICAKMAQGKLKQKQAVELVLEAKSHLDRTAKILDYINRM